MDKIWQMLQCNDTKSLDLAKDFEEPFDTAQQSGLLGPAKLRKYWTNVKDDE